MITYNIGENQEYFKNFLLEIGYNDQNKTTFWKDLIAEIQKEQGANEKVPSTSHPYPIREADFPEDTTLLKLISNLCDLEDISEAGTIDVSKLYQLIKDDDEKSFWNESIQDLCDRIKQLNSIENPTLIHMAENVDLTVEDFKNADAGANYSQGTDPPVHPYININNKNYDKVRGADQINWITNHLDKLDFTNDHSEWITLIMPNYGRGTKIEDLNRNFWVIAEAIDGISAWTMDGSPLQELLKKFLNELTQLWENCLYLWMHIALMNQKKSENIFVISDVIKASDCEHLMHYDNIPKITCKVQNNSFIINEEQIFKLNGERKFDRERLRYYSELYSQSVFGLLPIYRVNNYRHNYYSAEYYKNFYVWNPNKINNSGTFSNETYSIVELYGSEECPIIISPRYEINNRFSNKIFATRFNNNKYYYSYPFAKIRELEYEEPFLLYGCLKVVPDIKFTLNDIDGIDIERFDLKIYDAAAPIILGTERELGKFTFKSIDNDDKKISLEYIPTNFEQEEILELQTKYCSEISNAYYLGDVASWKKRIPIKQS